MTLDPRIRDLLERYPDRLSDGELLELRDAADADPRLDTLLDGLDEADDELQGDDGAPLGDAAAGRLEALIGQVEDRARGWSADLATPAAEADQQARGWSADLATPAAEADQQARGWSADLATPAAKADVVDLAAVRRRRMRGTALIALAAAVLVGAALALRPDPIEPEFAPRGEVDSIEGVLWVMGDARLGDGEARPTDAPVTFRAVLSGGPVSLVLLETQGGATHVLHPAPGAAWEGSAGSNPLVTAAGTQAYRPARSGRAEYLLLVAAEPPMIEAGPVASPEAFAESADARVLSRITIDWGDP